MRLTSQLWPLGLPNYMGHPHSNCFMLRVYQKGLTYSKDIFIIIMIQVLIRKYIRNTSAAIFLLKLT